jgi:hypothetical protein
MIHLLFIETPDDWLTKATVLPIRLVDGSFPPLEESQMDTLAGFGPGDLHKVIKSALEDHHALILTWLHSSGQRDDFEFVLYELPDTQPKE